MSEDPLNPSHYKAYKGVEVIQLTEQMNFNRGNAVKYTCRAGLKDPSKEIEDLEKAVWYLNREIDRLKSEKTKKFISYKKYTKALPADRNAVISVHPYKEEKKK